MNKKVLTTSGTTAERALVRLQAEPKPLEIDRRRLAIMVIDMQIPKMLSRPWRLENSP